MFPGIINAFFIAILQQFFFLHHRLLAKVQSRPGTNNGALWWSSGFFAIIMSWRPFFAILVSVLLKATNCVRHYFVYDKTTSFWQITNQYNYAQCLIMVYMIFVIYELAKVQEKM